MKKGFTLIELLSVMVVLAIIALITIPIISGVVNKAKLNALKDSAYGLIDASELYYAQYGLSSNTRFDINNRVITSNDTTNLLSYKGNVKTGVVIINTKGKTTICVTDGKNSAYKNYNETSVTLVPEKRCSVPSNTNIVYLDNEATITTLSTQELTSLVNSMQTEINTLKTQVTTLQNNSVTINDIYPIGSIYMSMTEDTVSKVQTKFGGTWVKLENTFLYGTSGTSNQTGGSTSISYTPSGTVGNTTLTVDQMPSHRHRIFWSGGTYSDSINNAAVVSIRDNTATGRANSFSDTTGGSQPHTHSFTGTTSNIDIMPPYTTVYMYKRTA